MTIPSRFLILATLCLVLLAGIASPLEPAQHVTFVWAAGCIKAVGSTTQTRIEAPVLKDGSPDFKHITITGLHLELVKGCEVMQVSREEKHE